MSVCPQLHVQDLNVRLACYDPWALQITNCCKSLLLLDTRETDGQTAESSEVIAIQKHLLTQVILPLQIWLSTIPSLSFWSTILMQQA